MLNEMTIQQEPRRLAPTGSLPLEMERALLTLEKLSKVNKRAYLKGSPNNLPYFVYRYEGHEISEKFLSDYLVDSYFWLNSVAEFNDPFDMSADVTFSDDVVKKREKYKAMIKTHMPLANWKKKREKLNELMRTPNQSLTVSAAYEKSIRDMGAICFANESRNLLMWSHYADHHRGFALQFHIVNDVRTMSRLSRVTYSNTYPALDWVDYHPEQLEEVFFTKHEGWKYEEEFRILIVDGAKTYLRFQPQAITGLIFGCRADLQLKQKVLSILDIRASKRLSPLKIYKAVKHPREYRVTIQKDLSLRWPK